MFPGRNHTPEPPVAQEKGCAIYHTIVPFSASASLTKRKTRSTFPSKQISCDGEKKMQFRKEQAEQNAAEMLTDPEILERNNRLRNAVLRNREFTCGRYSIRMEYFMYYPERAPSETPVHTHPLWELSFLSAGEMDYHLLQEKRTVALRANDGGWVLIPPRRRHFRSSGCRNVMILGFMLAIDGTEAEDDRRFLEAVRECGFRLSDGGARECTDLQELLARPPDVLDGEELAARLRLLLLTLFRENFRSLFRRSDTGGLKRNPVWIAERLISESLRRPFRAEELARRCGLSRRHFYRCFEAEYGLPVQEFIQRRRLLQAADDLLHTNRPLKEIADDAGFRNLSYFIRQFRRRYSVTPGEYRRKRKP